MIETRTRSQKLKQLLTIFAPIYVTQLAVSAVQVVDTMMAGQFSSVDLAGVAVGANIWAPVSTGVGGILVAVTPIVAQHLGAGRDGEVSRAVFQGLYLSLVLSLVVIIAGFLALPRLLGAMDLTREVHGIAHRYLAALGWGIFPFFAYTVLRCFFDALGLTRVTMAITLASAPVNVLLNYALIFGKGGLPALGGVGAGYASALTYWIVFAIGLYIAVRHEPFARYKILHGPYRVHFDTWREQLRIGVPLGLSIALEVGIFATVGLLMSRFGTLAIAAYQSATSFGGLIYMFPLSIAQALTIVVGYEVGASRIHDAIQYRRLGMSVSLSMAGLLMLGLWLFSEQVARLYTADPELLPLLESFLGYVIFFQLSDAIAAPVQGTLRGYKDVKIVLALAIVAYWCVGLPIGYLLATFTSLGPYGYWIGLISGLASGATGLFWRLRQTEGRAAKRLLPQAS